MDAENIKALQEVAGKMAACINHAGIEFNNFVKIAKDSGVDLFPAPPTPPAILDVARLDDELEFGVNNVTQTGRDLRLAAGMDGMLAMEASDKTARELYNQAAVELKGEKSDDQQSLETLIANTRNRVESRDAAAVDSALSEAEVVQEPKESLGMSFSDALRFIDNAYPNDKIVQALMSMTRYAKTDSPIARELIAAVTERTAPPVNQVQQFGKHTLDAISGVIPDQIRKIHKELEKGEVLTLSPGDRVIGQIADNGNLIMEVTLKDKGYDEVLTDKFRRIAQVNNGRHPLYISTITAMKINPEVARLFIIDDRTPQSEEEDLKWHVGGFVENLDVTTEEINGGAVFKLPGTSNTLGDTPGYEAEGAVTVDAEAVAKAQQRLDATVQAEPAFNAQAKFQELEDSYKRTNGLSILEVLLAPDVIPSCKGPLSFNQPMNIDHAHLYLGRFDEDILSIHPSETQKFPLGVYRTIASGTETLYIPSQEEYKEFGKLCFAIDNFRIKPTMYVCGRLPTHATGWLGMPSFTNEEEVVEIFLIYMRTVEAIMLALAKPKV